MKSTLIRQGMRQPASKHDCTCPQEGPLAAPEGWHLTECPTRRADWTRSQRLRYWLGKKIPYGGVTPFEGDDSQRPLTHEENYQNITSSPDLFYDDSEPRYLRFQRQISSEGFSYSLRGNPPPGGTLGAGS